jgi:hypothetical protein
VHTHVEAARTGISGGRPGAYWPHASPTGSTIMNYYMRPPLCQDGVRHPV